MAQTMRWFDRKFSFDLLPAWMYPNIVERVRGTPARVEELVEGISNDLATKRDGDKWSIQENVGHLLDLETLWLGRLDDFSEGRETLRPADLENRKTHEADHNHSNIEQILNAFREARREFVGRLDSYDDTFVVKTALHPRLKTPMRVIDLAFFVAEHDDHHLARITELVREFT